MMTNLGDCRKEPVNTDHRLRRDLILIVIEKYGLFADYSTNNFYWFLKCTEPDLVFYVEHIYFNGHHVCVSYKSNKYLE